MPTTDDGGTGARCDSYSRRSTREQEPGEAEEREVECELVKMVAISPTPCSDCISATMNRPELNEGEESQSGKERKIACIFAREEKIERKKRENQKSRARV